MNMVIENTGATYAPKFVASTAKAIQNQHIPQEVRLTPLSDTYQPTNPPLIQQATYSAQAIVANTAGYSLGRAGVGKTDDEKTEEDEKTLPEEQPDLTNIVQETQPTLLDKSQSNYPTMGTILVRGVTGKDRDFLGRAYPIPIITSKQKQPTTGFEQVYQAALNSQDIPTPPGTIVDKVA